MSLQNYTLKTPTHLISHKIKSPLFNMKKYSHLSKQDHTQKIDISSLETGLDTNNASSQYYRVKNHNTSQQVRPDSQDKTNNLNSTNNELHNNSSYGKLVNYHEKRDQRKLNKSQCSRSQSQSQFIEQNLGESKDAYVCAFDETTPKPQLQRPKQFSLHERQRSNIEAIIVKKPDESKEQTSSKEHRMSIVVEDISNFNDQVIRTNLGGQKEQTEIDNSDQIAITGLQTPTIEQNSPQLKLENLVNLWSKIKSSHEQITGSRETSKDSKALKYFNKNLKINAVIDSIDINQINLKKANSTQNQTQISILRGTSNTNFANQAFFSEEFSIKKQLLHQEDSISQHDNTGLNCSHIEAKQPKVNDPSKIQKSLALLKSRQYSQDSCSLKNESFIKIKKVRDYEVQNLKHPQVTPIQLAKQILEKNKQYFEKQSNQKSARINNIKSSNLVTPQKSISQGNSSTSLQYIQQIKKQYLTSYKQNMHMSPKISNKPQMREDSIESSSDLKQSFKELTVIQNIDKISLKNSNDLRKGKLEYIISQVKTKIDLQDQDQIEPLGQSNLGSLFPPRQRFAQQRNSMIDQQCQKLLPDTVIDEHNLEINQLNSKCRYNNHQITRKDETITNLDITLRVSSLSKMLPSRLKQPTVINKTPNQQTVLKQDINKLNQTAKIVANKQKETKKIQGIQASKNNQGTSAQLLQQKRNQLQSGLNKIIK